MKTKKTVTEIEYETGGIKVRIVPHPFYGTTQFYISTKDSGLLGTVRLMGIEELKSLQELLRDATNDYYSLSVTK